MAKKKNDIIKSADELVNIAMQANVEKNFFFVSTLKRYTKQLEILEDLEKAIEKDDVLVTKEYVKGRENIYTHPAITEYNKTAQAANNTVQTLMKIITTLADHSIADGIETEDDEL